LVLPIFEALFLVTDQQFSCVDDRCDAREK